MIPPSQKTPNPTSSGNQILVGQQQWLIILSVYGFEFLMYLAGTRAMPGWYESTRLPWFALHDWVYNFLWLLLFTFPAAVAIKLFTPPVSNSKPIIYFYCMLFFVALQNWFVFAWRSPLHVPLGAMFCEVFATGCGGLMILLLPFEKRRFSAFMIFPLILWMFYASTLALFIH